MRRDKSRGFNLSWAGCLRTLISEILISDSCNNVNALFEEYEASYTIKNNSNYATKMYKIDSTTSILYLLRYAIVDKYESYKNIKFHIRRSCVV